MKFINYFFLVVLFLFFSCSKSSESASSEMAAEESYSAEVKEITDKNSKQSTDSKPKIERKLIKEGSVEFETDDIGATRKTIFSSIKKYNAYASSDLEEKVSGKISNTLVVRMPAKDFDNFLADATQGVERFENKSIDVKDVTEEFLDIEARLKTKKELELRYLDLLKQAKKVSEILEIENQIGLLRAEIESIEGRLRYLKDRVSLSTLTLYFYQDTPKDNPFTKKFTQSFRNGWENMIGFFVLLANIWPILVVGIVMFLLFRWNKKRK